MPKLSGMVYLIGDFCAPDLVLTGQASDIRAGSADPAALDDGHAATGVPEVPGEEFAAGAAAEDDVLVELRLRHDNTPM